MEPSTVFIIVLIILLIISELRRLNLKVKLEIERFKHMEPQEFLYWCKEKGFDPLQFGIDPATGEKIK